MRIRAEVSNWMLERLVDMAAHELGMDRVELRRRNLLTPELMRKMRRQMTATFQRGR